MSTILAIETSSELASCALLRGDAVLSRASSGVRTHSQSILPMVQELLAEAGLSLADCDAIAYGSGPGSFTGVRTACGIAQGLAYGAGLPVVPVVTLDAMALACHQQHEAIRVLAVLDARMGEVYWAQYDFRDGQQIISPPALSAPAGVAPQGWVMACGNGFTAYAAELAELPSAAQADEAIMPHAVQIAQLARTAFAAGHFVKAADAQPLYLRNKIAYTSAERLDMAAAKAKAAAAEAGQ
ncbi:MULTISPECIES: tRNA (adenosine(37)-N6)-threonylcarbamoyltransferase complex dimerization subunit type 1 TsaB [unclassified Janthinobacterium]|uniref:tRNA (adenosine(37)-N6)-threonylcarbamoyltransferase complex dimerization subunit type 1 TsaB n=1 Tax=unclassified Janthinobacterium TaxID=2610881 RepID=UPI00160AA8D1|nr:MULTISPECIES: tRNA (adenosine(37)-N6)-threonylcarbamoyltransferase complex dimerization subunit type 1 TsaB [unclassified Janthinobacterium]MBB5606995.1 tRNA threonylcarbamoyladenosine biosynthesis protein TsaB [Janthinobacterium sp. S3T4]MBB5612721.1 tRNA threonylcarbamoyladenosine biosynthesis protein TsaB [Janthinobacterium sp. S3M3]